AIKGYSISPKNPDLLLEHAKRLKAKNWEKHRSLPQGWSENKDEIEKITNDYYWWIETFYELGLISDNFKKDAEKWVREQHFLEKVQMENSVLVLTSFLGSGSFFYNYSASIQNIRLEYLDSLLTYDCISSEKHKELSLILSEEKLLIDDIDLLKYLKNTFILDVNDFEGDVNNTEEVYLHFLNILKNNLLPNLRIDGIDSFIKLIENGEGEPPFESPHLAITLDGITYHQVFGRAIPALPKDMYNSYSNTTAILIGTYFIQSYLTDQKSKFRLYFISDQSIARPKGNGKVGLIFLEKEVVPFVQGFMTITDNAILGELQFNLLSFQEIKEILLSLQDYGIIETWSAKEVEEIIPTVRVDTADTVYRILKELPNTLADIYVSVPEYTPLEEYPFGLPIIIERLSKISNNKFTPKNIQKGWKEYRENATYPVSISFDFKGKSYAITIENEEDDYRFWRDHGIVSLVNSALEDQNIEERFFLLREGRDEYIFMRKKSLLQLKKKHPRLSSQY
ncbi:MAG: hypothetical protein AAFO82_11750, partial [Bacteroidota bacterium]